jgi:glycosyltransferase involved in cell wall biosynthesis
MNTEKIKGIKYISPCLDNSGYAKAARGYILALHKLGIPLTLEPISFEKANPDLGKAGPIIKSLIRKDIEYNIVIMHCTPEFWSKFKEENKFNVGYTIWETTKLHPDWAPFINNNADLLLVGCTWNIDIFKSSGVKLPTYAVPHAIPIDDQLNAAEYNIEGLKDDTFVFGFVSQFTERKNPLSLLKAYWHAFQNKENVALVMKTYRSDYSEPEKDAIRRTIQRLKEVTIFDNYPPIFFVSDMLAEDEMRALYKRLNCYISLDKGEGFGLSPFIAGSYGKPIIATGFGGVLEYLKPDNSFLVDYTLEPVFGMPYTPWYKGDQLWAQADIKQASDYMYYVFTHQEEAVKKGKKLQSYIHTNLNDDIIGRQMVDLIAANIT